MSLEKRARAFADLPEFISVGLSNALPGTNFAADNHRSQLNLQATDGCSEMFVNIVPNYREKTKSYTSLMYRFVSNQEGFLGKNLLGAVKYKYALYESEIEVYNSEKKKILPVTDRDLYALIDDLRRWRCEDVQIEEPVQKTDKDRYLLIDDYKKYREITTSTLPEVMEFKESDKYLFTTDIRKGAESALKSSLRVQKFINNLPFFKNVDGLDATFSRF